MNAPKWILFAEDDINDVELTTRALAAARLSAELIVTRDGSETLDCLYRRGRFRERPTGLPRLILLDLKMPKVDGLEVLRRIKADPVLKSIPVVIFTSSRERSDLNLCYELGANAYVVKPVNFRDFVATIHEVRDFWLGVNEPPADECRNSIGTKWQQTTWL
jgi:CheY-like chemotaxis protein